MPASRDARARPLWLDGLAGAVAGGVVLAFSGWFARLHQLPHDVVLFVGVANVLYGASALSLARRPDRTLRQVEVLAFADAAWVLVCVGLTVRYWERVSVFGIAHLLGEAAFVGALAARGHRARPATLGGQGLARREEWKTVTIEDLFRSEGKERMVARIEALSPDASPLWGKMTVAQMLAHCNVAYEIVHEPGRHAQPGSIGRFFARRFARDTVVGDKPYPRSGPTAPMFVVKDARDFDQEKARLLAYVDRTFEQGASHYEGLENMTFGVLTAKQWNTLFSKHLDHHLRQFGV